MNSHTAESVPRTQSHPALYLQCAGRNVTYLWTETSGKLPPGSFAARRPNLAVDSLAGVAGVAAGTVLTFSFTATLEGVASRANTTTSLSLTALASPVEANLLGPRGDVLVRRS